MTSGVVVREYRAPYPDRVEEGEGLVVVVVDTPTARLVLLADTPWNQGASMTNAANAVAATVVREILEPRGVDWRSVNWVELDSDGFFDVAWVEGPPAFHIAWRPLIVGTRVGRLVRSEEAFVVGYGQAAEIAMGAYRSLTRKRG